MGISFVALALIAFGAPVTGKTWLLGMGFGGLHIVFGILVGRASRGE
jgi:hypothetical protein